jgi:hypothetical protein
VQNTSGEADAECGIRNAECGRKEELKERIEKGEDYGDQSPKR